jgi:sulfur-oxidizing protein SoxY
MTTHHQRRLFLKGSLAASTLAVGAGLLTPQGVLAAWNAEAFKGKTEAEALTALLGSATAENSSEIDLNVPEIAENGAVVPVKVTTTLKAESISILSPNNPVPLTSTFQLGEGAKGFVSTRIKMAKTGDVVAIIKANGKIYSARKSVKVTAGGCGG